MLTPIWWPMHPWDHQDECADGGEVGGQSLQKAARFSGSEDSRVCTARWAPASFCQWLWATCVPCLWLSFISDNYSSLLLGGFNKRIHIKHLVMDVTQSKPSPIVTILSEICMHTSDTTTPGFAFAECQVFSHNELLCWSICSAHRKTD